MVAPAVPTVPAAAAAPATQADTVRLFIGLWPDDAQRWEARAHQQLWRWPPQARTTPASKLHLTMHFIGEVPPATIEPLAQALPRAFAATELRLTKPSVWRGGIAVLEPESVPAPLQALYTQLSLRVRQLNLTLEARPWRPHLTLARQATGAKPPTEPTLLRWRLTRLALVQSKGGVYEVLHSTEAG